MPHTIAAQGPGVAAPPWETAARAGIAPGVHTATEPPPAIALEVEAGTLSALFRAAAAETLALLHEGEGPAPCGAGAGTVSCVVELGAPDLAVLLGRFLRELLVLARQQGLEPVEIEFERLGASPCPGVRAVLACRARPCPCAGPRTVACDGVRLAHAGGQWRARVVFDP